MLSLGSPKIDLQHESPVAYDRLIEEVNKHITEEDVEQERNETMASPGSGPDNHQLAYQV